MQYETPKDPRSSLVRLNPIKYLAASKGRLLWLLLCLKIARWHWHCLGHQLESGHSRLETSLKRLFMVDIKTFKNVFLNSEKIGRSQERDRYDCNGSKIWRDFLLKIEFPSHAKSDQTQRKNVQKLKLEKVSIEKNSNS